MPINACRTRRLSTTSSRTPAAERGLGAQLTHAEQATLRDQARESEFAGLLVDLINSGAFGPLCGDADRVRLAASADSRDQNLELIKDGRVVASCSVRAHWELVAQHLAGAPLGATAPVQREDHAVSWLKRSGVGHAVDAAVVLAVHIHPLGAAAGLGTRLVQARLEAGREQSNALGRIGSELSEIRAETVREVANAQTSRRT